MRVIFQLDRSFHELFHIDGLRAELIRIADACVNIVQCRIEVLQKRKHTVFVLCLCIICDSSVSAKAKTVRRHDRYKIVWLERIMYVIELAVIERAFCAVSR